MMRLSWFKGVVVALLFLVVPFISGCPDELTTADTAVEAPADPAAAADTATAATVQAAVQAPADPAAAADTATAATVQAAVQAAVAGQAAAAAQAIADKATAAADKAAAEAAADVAYYAAQADPVTAAVGDTTKTAPAGGATTAASSKVTVYIPGLCDGSPCLIPRQVDTGVSNSVNKASQTITQATGAENDGSSRQLGSEYASDPIDSITTSALRILDSSDNEASEVNIDQQVSIAVDLQNTTSEPVAFAYLVQIQDSKGTTVSLAWLIGALAPQSIAQNKLGWRPDKAGEYTVTTFFWKSVDDPTALSPPQTINISVK